jgi:hypothetical protein
MNHNNKTCIIGLIYSCVKGGYMCEQMRQYTAAELKFCKKYMW